jgi:hypothetical protein
VQQKINDRLKEAYDQLKIAPFPPCRGIRLAVPAPTVFNKSIFCTVHWNSNNVLSVSYTHKCYYGRTIVQESVPLNFDLCTGEEISLRDVFNPGADYLGILGNALFKQLRNNDAEEEYWNDAFAVRLAGAYEPLSPDQKFILSDRNGGCYLELLFDYETPYISPPHYPSYLYHNLFDFADDVGIYTRFTGEGREPRKLYAAGENPERVLLYRDASTPEADTIMRHRYEVKKSDPGADYCFMIIGGRDVPREVEEQIFGISQSLPYFRAFLDRIGPFFSITFEETYDYDELDPAMREDRYFSWHAGGAEVKLKDLFRDGFDYEALLRAMLEEKLAKEPLYENDALREGASLAAEKERLVQALLERSPGIGAEAFSFSTPDTEHYYAEYAIIPTPLRFTLSYKDIGYENLTFFAADYPRADGSMSAASEEKAMLRVAMLRAATPQHILYFEYHDYDNDGKSEAFAFVGTKGIDGTMSGELWFVDKNGAQKISDDRVYWATSEVYTFGDNKFLVMAVYYATSNPALIWSVRNGSPYKEPISEHGGDFSQSNDTDFTMCHSTFDMAYLDFELNDGDVMMGHTWKEYYFYWDDQDKAFHEYGGLKISKTQLLACPGASAIMDDIESGGYTIGSIYFRANNIININYVTDGPVSDERDHKNATLVLENGAVKLKLFNYWGEGHTDLDNSDQEGIYRAALIPDAATYPESFTPNP